MADPKLSQIIMSVVLLGLIVSGVSIYVFGLGATYNQETRDIDDEFVQKFREESEITTGRLDSAREDLASVEEDRTVLDRLASFFRSGYDTALTLLDSFTSISRMINLTISNVPFLGAFGSQVTSVLITLALIVLVVGVFLHFLIKSERI